MTFSNLKSLSSLTLLIGITSTSVDALATNSYWDYFTNVKPVVSLFGGPQWMNNQDGHTYTGNDDDLFVYDYHNQNNSRGWIGAFIGGEWQLACDPNIAGQLGVSYQYFDTTNLSGNNDVGIEPATYTPYQFHYHAQSQVVLLAGKLFYTYRDRFHPYVSLGLGAAFNRTSDYSATTSQTGSINLTPFFKGEENTTFAFAAGLGLEADIVSYLRVGLGYQYVNVGRVTTKKGVVTINDYQATVPFSLENSNVYTNQFVISLSYIG